MARAVRRVPIRPPLVWSLDDVKPNHPLCFCNPTLFPHLPSSDQLFLVKSLLFVWPVCLRPFLTHTDQALAWQAAASKTADGKNAAAAVGAAAALPFRWSKGGSHTDDDGISHRVCASCYAAAARQQRRPAVDSAHQPGSAVENPAPGLLPTVPLAQEGGMALAAPAGTRCAGTAPPPLPLRDSLPAAQTGDAAKMGGCVAQSPKHKVRANDADTMRENSRGPPAGWPSALWRVLAGCGDCSRRGG